MARVLLSHLLAALLLLRSHIEQSKAEVRKITLHALFEARGRMLAGR